MLRTASARPSPVPFEPARRRVDRSRARAPVPRPDAAACTSAGTSTMAASNFRSGIPRRRARTDASTMAPSERRLVRSGIVPRPLETPPERRDARAPGDETDDAAGLDEPALRHIAGELLERVADRLEKPLGLVLSLQEPHREPAPRDAFVIA